MTGDGTVAYRIMGGLPVCLSCGPHVESLDREPVPAGRLPYDLITRCTICDLEISLEPCPFCEIAAGLAEADWILPPDFWPETLAFVPLDPVAEGHCLIVPKVHVRDFAQKPEVFATTSRRAAELMQWTSQPMDLLSTRGRAAGQTVMHLHLHLIPREENDGIRLLVKRKGKK